MEATTTQGEPMSIETRAIETEYGYVSVVHHTNDDTFTYFTPWGDEGDYYGSEPDAYAAALEYVNDAMDRDAEDQGQYAAEDAAFDSWYDQRRGF